jgi:hypothetical protein
MEKKWLIIVTSAVEITSSATYFLQSASSVDIAQDDILRPAGAIVQVALPEHLS